MFMVSFDTLSMPRSNPPLRRSMNMILSVYPGQIHHFEEAWIWYSQYTQVKSTTSKKHEYDTLSIPRSNPPLRRSMNMILSVYPGQIHHFEEAWIWYSQYTQVKSTTSKKHEYVSHNLKICKIYSWQIESHYVTYSFMES